ncbi:MAG: serine hydrolase [Bacteroidales bacterium]|nr:serine hydrolase [Bacteroidales bacterium]
MKGWIFIIITGLVPISCMNTGDRTAVTAQISESESSQGWMMYKNPEEAGFNTESLNRIREYFNESGPASLFVVYKGKVLLALGEYQRRFSCHSIRKSIVNSVYGINVDRGVIDPGRTLDQLGIDDISPLTRREKQATIRHLLQSRSGVYHPATYETGSMKRARPERGRYGPGEHWYYNNWDFNCLNTIFRELTPTGVTEAFGKEIASAIGLEDYREMDAHYFLDSTVSEHPACAFKMSARDLARFGQLYLQDGMWEGKKILSHEWIERSTHSYSNTGSVRGGYGYLWWIPDVADSLHCFAACGVGTQVLLVIKEPELIIVQRVNTFLGKSHPFDMELYRQIVRAKERPEMPYPEFIPLSEKSPPDYLIENRDKYKGNYRFTDGIYTVTKYQEGLMIEYPGGLKARLIQVDGNRFMVEDVGEVIELSKNVDSETGKLVLIEAVI